MTKRLDHKVAGGKLIRVEIEIDGDYTKKVHVRGDFFAHPETLFEEAETRLEHVLLSDLPELARRSFSRPDLALFGVTADAIAETLGRALNDASIS